MTDAPRFIRRASFHYPLDEQAKNSAVRECARLQAQNPRGKFRWRRVEDGTAVRYIVEERL